ncbi:hypothetical protein Goklo_010964 [Gossypium klotzschianum]|uniref:LRR receptor-like serine/threonine-protein kinase n=1 Tax=Gossypium klotzschianum TaxID=34286 RepID=A0A7J8V7L1_9ROSI|nr:hypothetical protein [Gossypium klotzschianum]
MKILFAYIIVTVLLVLICTEPNQVEAQVEPANPPRYEVKALREIAAELGKKDWNFSENPCNNKSSWFTPPPLHGSRAVNNSTVTCNCSFTNGECHIDGMYVLNGDKKIDNMNAAILFIRQHIFGNFEMDMLLKSFVSIGKSYLVGQDLDGVLPRSLGKLSYIKTL